MVKAGETKLKGLCFRWMERVVLDRVKRRGACGCSVGGQEMLIGASNRRQPLVAEETGLQAKGIAGKGIQLLKAGLGHKAVSRGSSNWPGPTIKGG